MSLIEYKSEGEFIQNQGLPSEGTFKIHPQNYFIKFTDVKTGEPLGTFKEHNGKLTFEGNVDEAGKVFTDYIVKLFNNKNA